MSFFEQVYEKVNPELSLRMNDVVFLMIASFFIGRLYEQRRFKTYQRSWRMSSEYNCVPHEALQLSADNTAETTQKEVVDEEVGGGGGYSKEQKQGQGDEDKQDKEVLLEKIKLEGKKLEERGVFEMFFEKKPGNSNFVRKIERHQIISDYFINTKDITESELVPYNGEAILPDQQSMLEISYYQNFKNSQLSKLQRKIVNLQQKPSSYSRYYLQYGRFKKLFRDEIKIGQGAFGTVVSAVNVIEGQKYAVKKVFIKSSNKNNYELQRVMGQIQVLSSVSHPNIVQYHTCWIQYASLSDKENSKIQGTQFETTSKKGKSRTIKNSYVSASNSNYEMYFESNNSSAGFSFQKISQKPISPKKSQQNQLAVQNRNIFTKRCHDMDLVPVMYIQMELCENNLAYYLKKRKAIDRKFAFTIMEGLFQGVYFLHKKRIVHRDLKPENIFLNKKKELVKIGDFGLSTHVDRSGKNERVGTPTYIAPELYALEKTGDNSDLNLFLLDIFSLGVIYFQLLTIFQTSHERSEKLMKLRQGKISGLGQFKEERKLIKEMIKEFNRPTIQQLLESKQYLDLSNLF